MEEIFVGGFPGDEGEHALDREGASVYEIAIEEVFVIDCGVAVELKNVEQVIILSVDVTTHSDLFFVFDGVVN
jgi:hypothetical protein